MNNLSIRDIIYQDNQKYNKKIIEEKRLSNSEKQFDKYMSKVLENKENLELKNKKQIEMLEYYDLQNNKRIEKLNELENKRLIYLNEEHDKRKDQMLRKLWIF